MDSKLNVGWDLDGVLQDSAQLFRVMMYNTFGTWDFKGKDEAGNERFKYEIEGVSNTKVWNVIKKVMLEYQHECQPFVDSIYALTMCANPPDPVHIITARPKEALEPTVEWCDRYIPVPHVIWFVDPPKNDDADSKNAKTRDVIDLGLTHFVEDRFKYASELAKECPDIEKVFLINKPYNKGRRTAEKVMRVDTPFEIMAHLGRDIR